MFVTDSRVRFQKLPTSLRLIYEKTIKALNSGSLALCTLGLRTLLEGICTEKGIKARNQESKIQGLAAFLPSNNIVYSANVDLHIQWA
jgi:hypothetical protein